MEQPESAPPASAPATREPPGTAAAPRSASLAVLAGLLLGVVGVLAAEGLASFAHAVRESSRGRYAEWHYCEYDPDLGWIGRPGVRLPDFFGPGRGVRTNSRRFRQEDEVLQGRPPGTSRIVCSGDSFTFGYGVDTREAWCNLLPRLAPGVETANMGQGGYGLDQAVLWYLRDGARLEHDVHVLAFVTEDMRRMEYGDFLGYGKPLLTVAGGDLSVTNTPVPRHHPAYRPLWLQLGTAAVRELRISRLLSPLLESLRDAERAGTAVAEPAADPAAVADLLLRDLAALHRRENRTLVLLYLPVLSDYYQESPEYLFWSSFMRAAAERHGALYLDLIPVLRSLPPDAAPALFLRDQDVPLRQAAGHYTAEGNRFVAGRLLDLLSRHRLLPLHGEPPPPRGPGQGRAGGRHDPLRQSASSRSGSGDPASRR